MSEKHILVADKIGPSGLDVLAAADDVALDVKVGLSKDELLEIIGSYEAVIVRSATTLDAELIDNATNLEVIGRAGVGVDNIDMETATRRGVIVTNTPQANATATAELTMALMLAASRHTAHAHGTVAAGEWDRSRYTGIELADRTLGIIGLGRIGREVARRARAFGMEVIAYDPYVTDRVARDQSVVLVELDQLLPAADFVTLHCALSAQTKNLIGKAAIDLMKPTATLINAARGGLIDEQAVAEALQDGRLRAAGIDVFSTEPPGPDNPLIGLPNVVHTPHIGAATEEAQSDVATHVAEQVLEALRGEGISNSVNFPYRMDKHSAPWLELATSMGKLQFAMAGGLITRVEIEARGEGVVDDIRPIASGVLAGIVSSFHTEAVNLVNAPALAAEHGIDVAQATGIGAFDYPNIISCRAHWDGGNRIISGVVFGGTQGRIVQVSRYHLDARPHGIVLLMLSHDVPGVIGHVGTLLGDHQVNIAEWRLGRDEAGGQAMSFINLDTWPGEEVLVELREYEPIIKAMVVEL